MQDLWYVRRESRVKGPFPCKMIVRSIARGQLLPTDEVSPDGSRWTALQRWERQFSAAANEPRSGRTGERLEGSRGSPESNRTDALADRRGRETGSGFGTPCRTSAQARGIYRRTAKQA